MTDELRKRGDELYRRAMKAAELDNDIEPTDDELRMAAWYLVTGYGDSNPEALAAELKTLGLEEFVERPGNSGRSKS